DPAGVLPCLVLEQLRIGDVDAREAGETEFVVLNRVGQLVSPEEAAARGVGCRIDDGVLERNGATFGAIPCGDHRSEIEILVGVCPAGVVEDVVGKEVLELFLYRFRDRLRPGPSGALSGIAYRAFQGFAGCAPARLAGALERGIGDVLRLPEPTAQPVVIRARRIGFDQMPKATGMKDRKSTRLNSSHVKISYAVICMIK